MNVQSFNVQYRRRVANQIELAQVGALDQIYFHNEDLIWKNPWSCFGHWLGLSLSNF